MNPSRNRRQSTRSKTLQFIDFIQRDGEGKIVARGLGRTLNLSEKGGLLETTVSFEPGQRLALTLGLAEELLELQGEVLRLEPCEGGFRVALVFQDLDTERRAVLQRFLAASPGIGR